MSDPQNHDVSRETMDLLRRYQALVEKWNPTINLVSKRDLPLVWSRHILDSLQVPKTIGSYDSWLDVGSGGGFPGIVVAICALATNPDANHVLIESDLRKCTFLRTVIRELGLKATVINDRIETVEPIGADVVSARALARLDVLCGFASHHLKAGGKAIFLKGKSAQEEIEQAKLNWNFKLMQVPSTTEQEASLLVLEEIERV